MIRLRPHSLVAILILMEWASLWMPSLRLEYYAVGVTVLLLHLLPRKWWGAVVLLQAALAVHAPGAAYRASWIAALALAGSTWDRLSYRWSLVGIGVLFLFLARVQGYPLPLLFMGVFGFGAVVYAVSRQPDMRLLLNRYLAIQVAAIPLYTIFYLWINMDHLLRPVVVIPLDMVQIVCAGVVIRTAERWWEPGS